MDEHLSRHVHRSDAPHRLPAFDYASPDHVYFVTACARCGEPFRDPGLAQDVIDSLFWLRQHRGVILHAYCLMPDHLHLLLGLSDRQRPLGALLGAFKSYTTRCSWQRGGTGALWQARFYDHIVRNGEDGQKIAQYIVDNPVRKGLAGDAHDYRWSGHPDPL